LFALLLATAPLSAQDFAGSFDPRSGDAWVDAQLADINAYGTRWPGPFTDELARYYGAPRSLVDDLLQRRWAPGDIYFACALAQAAGRPCRAVVEEWEQHHGEGWGVLAQRLGIAPGSPAFHRLKRGFVPSYDRWGRPIHLDASLRDDFPGRDGAPPPGLPAPPPGHDEGKAGRHGPPGQQQKKAKDHGHGHG
jgi:hypothetical protein